MNYQKKNKSIDPIDKQIDDYLEEKKRNRTIGKIGLLIIFGPVLSLVYIVIVLYLIKWILL